MPGLTLNIGANVSDAAKKFKDFGGVVEGSLEEARLSVKLLKGELFSLRDQLDTPAGISLVKDLKEAQAELKNFNSIGKPETGNALGSAFGALRKIAYILPGIGVAGLIGFATDPIIKYVTALFGVSKEAQKAQEELTKLKDALNSPDDVTNQSIAGEQGNIAKVQALAAAVQDSNLSYVERKRALQDLVEINKQYFGDIKLEQDQMGLLTQRVNEYTEAITKQAVLKGFTEEIGKVSLEIFKEDKALKQLITTRDQLAEKAADLNPQINGEVFASGYDIAVKAVKKADEAITGQRDKVDLLAQNYAELKSKIGEAARESLKFEDLKKPGKQEDELKKQLAALERIQKIIKDTDQLVGIGERIYDLKVRILFRDAAKQGLSKEEVNATLQGYREELEKAFNNQAIALEAIPKVKFSQTAKVEIPSNINFFASTEKKGQNFLINDLVAKATGLDKAIPVITIQEARVRLLGLKLGTRLNEIEKLSNELNKQVAQTIGKGLADAFSSIGEDIGDALTGGGGLQKAAEAMLGIIGSTLQEIGKQVIAYGVALLFLKSAIAASIANPAVAIAAGIGLVALGQVFKSIHFGAPKLAEGGITSRSTFANIGEAGQEAIIPLTKLPSIINQANGGGGQTVISLGIRANELIAFIDRNKKLYSRTH